MPIFAVGKMMGRCWPSATIFAALRGELPSALHAKMSAPRPPGWARPPADFCARRRACIVPLRKTRVGVMWGRRREEKATNETPASSPLQRAIHQARIEAAERTSVVVDLRDAEAARLELLNEALDPLFAVVPAWVDLFDRGLSRGDTPRLWIDPVAHVAMGRDKRTYRFLYDTRIGRRVLAESHEIAEIVRAVTDYVARRLVEREQALAEDSEFSARIDRREAQRQTRRRRRRGILAFVLGFLACLLALLLAAAILASLS